MDEPKFRHELKFAVSAAQIAILRTRISGIMTPDPHAGSTGKYRIASLYFDDYYNRCYYENENGVEPREKFRIRHYARDIFLECKRKEHGMVNKTSVQITEEEADRLIHGQRVNRDEPLLNRFTVEQATHLMHPVIIVEYERYPFLYRNGNVRVTFDTNISSSNAVESFLGGSYPLRPIMPAGMHLMEVKFDEYLPDFIHDLLQTDNLQLTTFSKYYLCRKYSL